MTELSTIIFENNRTVLDLKERIIKEKMTKLKINIDNENLLIRENVLDRPGKVK
jgi:hypothetical protein